MAKKILSLDAHEAGKPEDDRISGLSRLCQGLGLEVIRYSSDDWQKFPNVGEFADEFIEKVWRCDLILGHGSYFWVKFFRDQLGVNSAIVEAIDAGKPFIFQSVRGWERFFSPQVQPAAAFVQNLFRHVGVEPTPVKVFSDDVASPVGGGAVVNFRAGDDCFLNADILGESDSLTLVQPNCQRRCKIRPWGGAKVVQSERDWRLGRRAPHIADGCQGALVRKDQLRAWFRSSCGPCSARGDSCRHSSPGC